MKFFFNLLLISEVDFAIKIDLWLRCLSFSLFIDGASWFGLFDFLPANSSWALKKLHTLKWLNLILDLVKGWRPIIWLPRSLLLFFSLEGFPLYLFLDKFLCLFFKFYIKYLVIMLHNTLNSHCAGNNIPKPSHPHVPLIGIFGTKDK